jgi:ribosome-associated protein
MKTPRQNSRPASREKRSKASSRPRVTGVLPVVEAALADMKAVDVRVLDVRGSSDVTDYMVIASGTSDRHLRAVADRVVQMAKAAGHRPLGVEGEEQGEWVLVDLPDVMVHILLPRTREFYQLEQLWEPVAPKVAEHASATKTKRAASRTGAPSKRGSGGAPRRNGTAPKRDGARTAKPRGRSPVKSSTKTPSR